MRIAHIITGLATGGAEMMLYKLLSATRSQKADACVISLTGNGPVGERIAALGVPVHALGMHAARHAALACWRLRRHVCRFAPEAIQGWMYHGNLAAYAARFLRFSSAPVLWNIRHSLDDPHSDSPRTRRLIRIEARLASQVEAVLYNSRVSAAQHEALGYDARRTRIVPNGFDVEKYCPAPAARRRIRAELGLAENDLVVGMVGRYHPVKDHAGFLRAVARLMDSGPQHIVCVMAGRGVDEQNHDLLKNIDSMHLGRRTVRLLGERSDVASLMCAFDILCSCGRSEGFPNVVGEAMACEVPCVVTDTGDSSWLVNTCGILVPPRDVDRLVEGLLAMCRMPPSKRQALGHASRQRIIRHFSLDTVAAQYMELYADVMESARCRVKETRQ